ncbi:MAG: PVC-type heme-binding CxxCH protein, partial [Limisphaerales bacterium]
TAVLALTPITALTAEFKIGPHAFTLPDGFTVQKVAGPGLIDRPIVADFDEQGRLYVAESSGSNDPVEKQLKEKPHRILRLEDTDGDGIFDRSTIYADKMMFPEGTMWLDGSLYVSAPPVIWKLTDTDDDGVADKREEWLDAKTLTGCANDLHGPYLGPDGWIYWCKGAFAKQTYDRPDSVAFETRAAHIFRRRPKGGLIEVVMTGGMDNPVDVTFTPEGERIFTTTFFQHPGGGRRDGLVHAIYGGVYGKVHDVIDNHKKTGDLMPVLTHLGPAAPSGLTRYESQSFGKEYRDNLFAALFNLHKVTRHVLTPSGATYQTTDSDFLVSDQTDFHPTDVIEDADGSLLVIDTGGWYKLCCPTSQLWKPDVLGAIYRIRRNDAPKMNDPRGGRINWQNASISELSLLLGDDRPAVVRRTIHTLRRQPSVAAQLEKVIVGKGPERQKLNAVWALSSSRDTNSLAVLNDAIGESVPTPVRHAALHALSVNNPKRDIRDPSALLGDSDPHIRRAAAESFGRTGNEGLVPALLRAAGGLRKTDATDLPDRVQEHSIIFALIEINAPDATRKGLSNPRPFARRAALIALDQMENSTLQASEVIPFLSSNDPVLTQTAHWIIGHRKEWGADLAGYFEARIKRADLTEGEWNEVTAGVVSLIQSEEIRAMVGKLTSDTQSDARTRGAMLQVMARSGLRETPASWTESITTLLKAGRTEPEIIAAAAAFRLKETPAALRSQLASVARNSALPTATRLQAVSAQGAGAKLDAETYKLVASPFTSSEAGNDRRLASAILSKASLDEAQLAELCAVIQNANPLEMSPLLTPYEKGSTEKVGFQLLTTLKSSRALASLTADQVQRTFAKFPAGVKTQAAEFANSVNVDLARQSAMIEELLPKLTGGDIRRGQAIFNSPTAACSTCHAIGYLGGDL